MRIFKIVFAVCLLFSCGSENQTNQENALQEQVGFSESDTIIIWNCDADKQERSRIFTSDAAIQNVQPLINGINSIYPEIALRLVAISGDTLIVAMNEGKLLVNQMGSSGAEQYLSFAAMNLLEAKGIQFVQFSLPEGAHAKNSVWTKADFADWKMLTE